MFMHLRDTKFSNWAIRVAGQSSFVHISTLLLLVILIVVGAPQHGQVEGITKVLLLVKLSSIFGITMLLLYTVIVSPMPSSSCSIIERLWSVALVVSAPSKSISSKIATGEIILVLVGVHSTSLRIVSYTVSFHFRAILQPSWWDVAGSDLEYNLSSSSKTSPSQGYWYNSGVIVATQSSTSPTWHLTTSKPICSSHFSSKYLELHRPSTSFRSVTHSNTT